MIFGDANPSTLATNLSFLYHPLPRVKIELKVQTGAFPCASDCFNSMARIEYLGRDSTITLALRKPKRDSGRMTIGFLQSFNNNFCAGAQLLTDWSSQNRVQANIALAARYVYIEFDEKTNLLNSSKSFFLCVFICRSSISNFHVCVIICKLNSACSLTTLCALHKQTNKHISPFQSTQIPIKFPFDSLLWPARISYLFSFQIFGSQELSGDDSIKGCIKCELLASTERFIAAWWLICFQ